jgi:hypothetical protein
MKVKGIGKKLFEKIKNNIEIKSQKKIIKINSNG